jgi:hypothetical protein
MQHSSSLFTILLTSSAVYAQTRGARFLSPTNTSRLPPGDVKFSIFAPPLSGSGMTMELRINDFMVAEVTEDVAVILNDMPEGWCVSTLSCVENV